MSSQDDPERGIGAARDWIAAEMRSFSEASEGRMTVETPSFIQPPNGDRIDRDTNIINIVAILKGDTDPGGAYLISGHYDSRNSDPMDFEGEAPGADDDASGVAVSMELARIMSTRRTATTLMFVAVAGEEQGLLGATNLADQLTSENSTYDLQGMFTNDIIGSPKADDGTVDPHRIRLFGQGVNTNETETAQASRLILGGENDTPPRQLARLVREVASNDATNVTVNVIYRIDRFLRGGDYRPFLERGIAAARFTEPHEDYAHQHQDVRLEDGQQYGDLLEFCDFDFISRVARVSGAALWSLANAPGTPKNITIDALFLGNNSTLGWTLDEAVESYEVVWRATNAPFWSNVIDVGKTDTTTIRQSKDNAVFGVRAVGRMGIRARRSIRERVTAIDTVKSDWMVDCPIVVYEHLF
ncbi:aminopeptidase [Pterulicium gracile]|uniref:Peptide hydrolase n=1 Tax=Pterulicium gracile TaxID=1884261 RepID=A0A5C3Q3L5_9AGAR|nr:aminopeptidase [Pterula gracilis]